MANASNGRSHLRTAAHYLLMALAGAGGATGAIRFAPKDGLGSASSTMAAALPLNGCVIDLRTRMPSGSGKLSVEDRGVNAGAHQFALAYDTAPGSPVFATNGAGGDRVELSASGAPYKLLLKTVGGQVKAEITGRGMAKSFVLKPVLMEPFLDRTVLWVPFNGQIYPITFDD